MALQPLGTEISRGVFVQRVSSTGGVRVDRYVVQPGVTVPFHTNAKGRPYILVACSSLKFVSLGEDAKLREYRQMEPGEILNREAGFGHQFINVSDQDFVALKIWSEEGDVQKPAEPPVVKT
jgi:uncharacterized cupin superfamily protein